MGGSNNVPEVEEVKEAAEEVADEVEVELLEDPDPDVEEEEMPEVEVVVPEVPTVVGPTKSKKKKRNKVRSFRDVIQWMN